jgi:hypothetical protein
MLTAAAVCPHPPLLVPEATGGRAGSDDVHLAGLRQACDAAVATLTAASPDVLVVVGGADRSEQFPPDAPGSLQDFGVPFLIGTGDPVLPLSLTIGRWLLSRAPGAPDATALYSVAVGTAPDECLAIGAELAGLAPSVALLAMGDGPGRRARQAPNAMDPAADDYDDTVARALATADPAALAALDPADDDELFVAGRAAWQVMAGAMRATPTSFRARLHYAGAPFEVSYFAASLWQQPPE